MTLEFQEKDLEYFCKNIWDNNFSSNDGGMGAPDLFSLYFILNYIKPKVIVESGVWNGISTKLIRKVCPDAIIICLDPRDIPSSGFKDKNKKTIYYLGKNFVDFSNLDLSKYNSNEILCFFDCHQNAYLRLLQCINKKIINVFFNDNYPVNCGSHFTIEHLKNNDFRHYKIDEIKKQELLNLINIYHIFPNIYPGQIKTGEGLFSCCSFYEQENSNFPIFNVERNRYRWNTYVKLKVN